MNSNASLSHPSASPFELPAGVVDLRSDTVTRPTEAMYERMCRAPLGDDGLDGDPTARELEAYAAEQLGKPAGLFVPSCTMGNLLAAMAQGSRSGQVLLEASSHMMNTERGGATLAGLFYVGVAGTAGAMDLERLRDALAPASHRLPTTLVGMESSHNHAGGAVLSLDHMAQVQALAREAGAAVHLDGARVCNAAVALKLPLAQVAASADTVSLCLSKGLSAPAGAVLAGSTETIRRARDLRRMLGGAQRQIGVLAAAGLEALQTMQPRLHEDHARATRLSEALRALGSSAITVSVPATNIVLIDVAASGRLSGWWSLALEARGLKARPWGSKALRCVTHRHITDASIAQATAAFAAVLGTLGGAAQKA